LIVNVSKKHNLPLVDISHQFVEVKVKVKVKGDLWKPCRNLFTNVLNRVCRKSSCSASYLFIRL